MKTRRFQFGLFVAAVAGLLAVGFLGESVRSRDLPDHSIVTPYGTVDWNHELHARLPDFNCQSCHHRARAGTESPTSCLDCHLRLDDPDRTIVEHHEQTPESSEEAVREASPAMIAFHNKCIGCHKAKNLGPVGCRECHALPPSTPSAAEVAANVPDGPENVVLGHVARQYEPIEFSHQTHAKDYTSRCDECHHHASEVEATPSCRACHTSRLTAEGSTMPGLIDAYHGQCIACHKKNESGPMDCGDCHQDHDPKIPFPAPKGPKESKLGQLSVRYQGVVFDHAEHVDMTTNCSDCHHHTSEVDPVPACRECHNRAFTPKGERKLGLVDAYHTQCVRCHVEQGGPNTCDGCHAVRTAK